MKLVPRSDRQQPWLTLWSASSRAVKKQKLKESRMTSAAKSDLNRFRKEKKGPERRTLEEHLKEHFLQCLDRKAPYTVTTISEIIKEKAKPPSPPRKEADSPGYPERLPTPPRVPPRRRLPTPPRNPTSPRASASLAPATPPKTSPLPPPPTNPGTPTSSGWSVVTDRKR